MQEGGSQYGVPPLEMTPFADAGTGSRACVLGISGSEHLQQPQEAQKPGTSQQEQLPRPLTEAASPISRHPPMHTNNFDELAPAASGALPDEDVLAAAGEEADRGSITGNRWPREETLALLRIRSEMDATFRDATPKGPLWEHVSRKLAELGYKRSAKKCKEKFENVHKYYKRTKDGRAGRQDGKNYRFFSQLEALHSSSGATAAATAAPPPAVATGTPNPPSSSIGMVGSSGRLQPTPLNAIPLPVGTSFHVVPEPVAGSTAGAPYHSRGFSFSSNNSSSASESEEEDTEEGLPGEPRKRKRKGGGGSRKMMSFFEGLMKQVVEKQEAMQQKFLEMIEKREQDRMIREEAWRRQEIARLSREHEMMAQERVISASRDAAIIGFLEKMTGQTVPIPPARPTVGRPIPVPQPPPQEPAPPAVPMSSSSLQRPPPAQPQGQQHHRHQAIEVDQTPASALEVVPLSESQGLTGTSGGSSMDPASSRWPKSEVHALIKLRSGMDSKYQEAGPKGPLWEEIAAGMRQMGYNRSAKRCKEKWENINKYFKKVKESNKKRPEDAKTCPYFHQLDALYRKKSLGSSSSLGKHTVQERENSPSPAPNPQYVPTAPPPRPAPPQQPQEEAEGKNNGGQSNNSTNNNSSRNVSHPDGNGVPNLQMRTGNGEGVGSDGFIKKPEDIMKDLMDEEQRQQHAAVDYYDKLEETDSDSMGQVDDDDDGKDDEKREVAYQIEYLHRPAVNGTPNGGGNQPAVAAAAAAAAAGSFMATVQ